MKKLQASLPLIVGMALLGGCAAPGRPLVLAPVGPPAPLAAGIPDSNGSLVVFSALDPHPTDYTEQDWDIYTDYKIFSGSGEFLMKVRNSPRPWLSIPAEVKLPVGQYRVVARANGYGQVTVPVVIESHQTTTLHLEGDGAWNPAADAARNTPVRLPDGQIVGWSAEPRGPDTNNIIAHSGPKARLLPDDRTKAHTN